MRIFAADMMVRSQDDVILPIGYWGDVHGVTVPHPFFIYKNV